ncbi:MAG: tRNA uridine-5-carboxymethylaminomethyl(34) synthesis GTPase MnmE [Bacteroidaceae bacterium]|nr:tRNA uridine-5-carboxymethylaminomethyl(34) synthesis GTPase MnmE [Bacteroidaceae bacterium]
MISTDTICAISTAQGGAIGVIRVSGSEAIAATDRIFRPMSGAPLTERKPRTAVFGHIIGVQGEIVDEVLVTHFCGPHSYTGEDSVEISCHGSSYILQQVMRLLTSNGCRLAAPGEYTQRAFLNGKMDLSQAEAVADLIASTSAATHRLAMNQMRGGFSKELSTLRDKLLHLTSLMELELDFSDHEELEFADRSELSQIASDIERTVSRLVHSFSVGNAIKNGVPVAIIGETNVGKSTLLNALVGEERAIVSDIHGTTRDVIEDTVNLRGITFRFIDTAGIRQTTDVVESIGIERTYQKMFQADIILWMIDATQETHPIPPYEGGEPNDVNFRAKFPKAFEEIIFPRCPQVLPHREDLGGSSKPLLLLFNMADKITAEQREALLQAFAEIDAPKFFISAKERTGLEELERILVDTAALPDISQSDVIVTNARHYEALTHALDSIHRVQDGLAMQLSGDFVSQDLRECIHHLSDIVGEVSTDSVLQNIFKHFCIGK